MWQKKIKYVRIPQLQLPLNFEKMFNLLVSLTDSSCINKVEHRYPSQNLCPVCPVISALSNISSLLTFHVNVIELFIMG